MSLRVLEVAGYNPSFLIGGVVEGFGVSSRLTDSNFLVIEAVGFVVVSITPSQ
jgi:UDP-N-acetylmuramate: L-alanyl-gamma-D-glutamyl-meso-diaminopimelate ligase